jgi:hypothetical protein
MSGKTVRAFTIAVLLMAGGMQAAAETPSENVTVTATRSREVLGKFTRAFATPTEVTGKMARWERRLCPVVVGQNTRYTTFITQHIKYVALAAGAPVNSEASCRPNIEIVFTTTPQALLDAVRKDDPIYLGYAATSAQEDALATVTRPIQAWYTTETVDLKGIRSVDSGLPQGEGVQIQRDPPVYVQRVTASNGNHIDDGIHTGFNHILIVIDSARVAGQDIVPLADYISMLALTQLGSLDACQELPSVVNILAPNCGHAADGITEFDLAYLQGLYKMRAGRSLMLQRNAIADAMTDTLAKAK